MSWPEVLTAKAENRHEIKLSGAAVSKRISEDGLDRTIFSLSNLNLLNISDTCLSTIPNDIKLLVNLQSLLLFGNKIEEFNENITSLPKLKVLDLSRNALTSLPESLNKLKELTSLNLSSNQINSMPKFIDFPNLLSVDISNNKLTSFLETDGSNLPHLSDLILKSNAIESIPNNIAKDMPLLKNFDMGENKLKEVPGELASMTKLKELNLKGNKLSDKRLMKLVDQCRTKQVVDYIREHCKKAEGSQSNTKKGKKGQKKEEPVNDEVCDLCHSMKILHVDDSLFSVKIEEKKVIGVRPYILCCIIKDISFTPALFKKFIQVQTKLHDSVCEKRNVATIATHDLSKIPAGDLRYTAKAPSNLKLVPLMRQKPCTGEQLFSNLTAEAEALRKEKKRNVFSGIHKYLYLLEGKPMYPCLEDSTGRVISFPPITNSEDTKMSPDSKAMFVEVTSQLSLGSCKAVLDQMLHEFLMLGIGDTEEEGGDYHTLNIQQVKIVDTEGNLKSVYPSRTDCIYEGTPLINVYRLPKK